MAYILCNGLAQSELKTEPKHEDECNSESFEIKQEVDEYGECQLEPLGEIKQEVNDDVPQTECPLEEAYHLQIITLEKVKKQDDESNIETIEPYTNSQYVNQGLCSSWEQNDYPYSGISLTAGGNLNHAGETAYQSANLQPAAEEGPLFQQVPHGKRYSCTHCLKTFTTLTNFIVHQQIHRKGKEERPFTCPLCRKSFYRAVGLQKHQESHTMEKSLRCSEHGRSLAKKTHLREPQPQCRNAFSGQRDFRENKQMNAETNQHPCSYCGKTFVTEAVLEQHLQVHDGERANPGFKEPDQWYPEVSLGGACTADGQTGVGERYGRNQENVERILPGRSRDEWQGCDLNHMGEWRREALCFVKAEPDLISADGQLGVITGEGVKTQGSKDQYLNHETRAKPSCSQSSFIRAETTPPQIQTGARLLSGHATRTHRQANTGRSVTAENKTYSCSRCGRKFNSTINYIVHLQIHRREGKEERPFSCLKCGKRFYREKGLIAHQQSRTGRRWHCQGEVVKPKLTPERRYVCPKCAKTFSTKRYLEKHMQTHLREKVSSCSVCGKSFPTEYGLRKHKQAHWGEKLRGEKSYSCSHCGKTFMILTHYIVHQQIHRGEGRGERAFSCSTCGKCFYTEKGLRTHMERHRAEKTFGCSQCDKKFTRQSSFREHLKVHSEITHSPSGKALKSHLVFKRHQQNHGAWGNGGGLNGHAAEPSGERAVGTLDPGRERCGTGGSAASAGFTSRDGCRVLQMTHDTALRRENGLTPGKYETSSLVFTNEQSQKLQLADPLSKIKLEVNEDMPWRDGSPKGEKWEQGNVTQKQNGSHRVNGFTTNNNGPAHREIPTGEKPYQFPRRGLFRDMDPTTHRQTCSGSGPGFLSIPKEKKTYCCAQCGKSFATTTNYLVHLQIHKRDRPFSCLECGKSYYKEEGLKTHQKTHSGGSGRGRGELAF